VLLDSKCLDQIVRLPRIEQPLVSPDTAWVAWSWFGLHNAADVYVAPTDATHAPIRLTRSSDNTRVVSWTADSRALLVEEDAGGNERARLYRIDIEDPAEAVPLTAPDPRYFLRGGSLHSDGQTLIYGANVDLRTDEEIEPTCVIRHDLDTGVRTELARPLRGAGNVPKLNAAGTHVLYTRSDRDPAGSQLWLVDIDGAEDVEILNVGDDLNVTAEWLPDGRRAAVLVEAAARTHRRLGIWDLETRAVRWILDDPDLNVEEIHTHPASERIVALDVRGARTRSLLVDPETGAIEEVPARGDTILLAPLDGGDWVALRGDSTHPDDVVRGPLHALGDESVASLSLVQDRTPLRPRDLCPAEDYRWRARDGVEIQGWLFRPPGEPLGTIILVHGGPTWHVPDRVDREIQSYCHAGFTVLAPNFRGSTGFSLAFQEAIQEEGWGSQEQQDIRAGIEALINDDIAEPGRIGITGLSFGGYSSWYAITRFPPELVCAAAPVCGMTDLVIDYETTRPDLRPLSERMMGGSPHDVPMRYRVRSPIHYVTNIEGRLLIVQGLRDPNVTPEHVEAIKPGLEAAHVTYDVLTFADEGHGIEKPVNQRTMYARIAEFFAEAFAGSGA
jgi:dipeptidyl aminopeptidase/acylaminoacyl peptidase